MRASVSYRLFVVLCLAGLVCFSLVEGHAVAPMGPLPPRIDRALSDDYLVRFWGRADGLPADRINGVTQTRDGFLWVATASGLVRFDGVRFVRFDHAQVRVLADSRIARMAEDAYGALWVGTEDRLVTVFTQAGWRTSEVGGRPTVFDYRLHSRGWGEGRVWIATTSGWMHTPAPSGEPGESWGPTLRRAAGAPDGAADVFEVSPHERCWVTPGEVIFEGAPFTNRVSHRLPPVKVGSQTAAALAKAPAGSLWLLYGEYLADDPFRLYRVSREELVLVDDALPPHQWLPTFLAADEDGGVWHPAGPNALGRSTAERRWRYRLPGDLGVERPLDAALTHDGSLWVVLEHAGLLQLRPRRVRSVRGAEGLADENVQCVIAEGRSGLLAGTDDGLMEVALGGGRDTVSVKPVGLEGMSVRALARAKGGELWAGTSRGVFRGGPGNWRAVPLPRLRRSDDGAGLGSAKVRDLLATRRGDLWVATAHQVAVVPVGENEGRCVAAVPGAGPMDLMEDRAGRVWLAMERGGVAVFAQEGGVPADLPSATSEISAAEDRWFLAPSNWLRDTNGLASDQAWLLHEDREGVVWIAGDRGLHRVPADAGWRANSADSPGRGAGRELFVFSTRHGFPEVAITSLLDDEAGRLWLGCGRGVFRVPRSELAAVARGDASRVRVEVFGRAEGLPAEEINGRISHPTACLDGAGQAWFATPTGLAGFEPQSEAQARAREGPRVAIEELRADGAMVATTLPQDPAGGVAGGAENARTASEGANIEARRGIAGEFGIEPGRGRVLEVHFTGFDFAAPSELRFRYELSGPATIRHEIGSRRVAYFTNLVPGRHRFRVWAADREGRWSPTPAEVTFHLQAFVWQMWWFRLGAIAAGGMLLAGVVAWRFRHVRRFEALRRRVEKAELRAQLVRDLHDGVGSGLARLAALAHVPASEPLPSAEAARKFRDLSVAVREVAETVREISWSSSPSPISLEALVAQIAQQTAEYCGAAGIRCRTLLPLEFPELQLSPDQRSNLYYAMKEAVANVLRHAEATEARLEVGVERGQIRIALWDNGRGLDRSEEVTVGEDPVSAPKPGDRSTGGNGLLNLRTRVGSLGGQLEFLSQPGAGTQVVVVIPLDGLGQE